MNGNLFFSIIVPVYNVMDYLEECMSSLLSQNMENYEIVLVDDGWTDGSSDLCDSFAEDNPAVVRVFHQDNKGLLRTRRVAFPRLVAKCFCSSIPTMSCGKTHCTCYANPFATPERISYSSKCRD